MGSSHNRALYKCPITLTLTTVTDVCLYVSGLSAGRGRLDGRVLTARSAVVNCNHSSTGLSLLIIAIHKSLVVLAGPYNLHS